MNIPLSWLAEYVSLPKDITVLTDKLTMIGHMLDKTHTVGKETVIDLELRGNRSDLFGIFGVARDVAAAFDTKLTYPPVEDLPKTDPKSKLVTVGADDLVERFFAFTLSVTVKKSPDWIKKRLELYGIASINNVVDITNYVMVETGEPMHAYDVAKLEEGRLILRRAKMGEHITTLAGQMLTLSDEDLVIADAHVPQGLTMIGGKKSSVTNETKEVLLEAAVYNQANVRRSARRLKVHTEAGGRHEKRLDVNMVPLALSRALYLLKEYADAKVTSKACDIEKKPRKPILLYLNTQYIKNVSGLTVTEKEVTDILTRLECTVVTQKSGELTVTVPTFRTDIEEAADLVEEVSRMHGYEHIPTIPLAGVSSVPKSAPSVIQEQHIHIELTKRGCDEIITSPIIENNLAGLFAEENKTVFLVNAPDPRIAALRPSMLPSLLQYAKKLKDNRFERVSVYEVGKTYEKIGKNYEEHRRLGIVFSGNADTKSWNKTSRPYTVFDLSGMIESFFHGLGVKLSLAPNGQSAIFDRSEQGQLFEKNNSRKPLGSFGKISLKLQEYLQMPEMFAAELYLDAFVDAPKKTSARIISKYPPIVEDFSFLVDSEIPLGNMIADLKKIDMTIADIHLLDVYENKRTLQITFQHPEKTLSQEDILPLKEAIIKTAKEKHKATLVTG